MLSKLCLVAMLFIICTIFLNGDNLMAEEIKSSLEKYKWALQFGIQENPTLGSFEAGDFSFKRQINTKSALRFGISVNYSYKELSSQVHRYMNDISIIYQRYINPLSLAKFYWGTGPYLHYLYNRDIKSSDYSYTKRINTSWGLGLLGLAGIEWFATSVISFHAEYRAKVLYVWEGWTIESVPTGEEPFDSEGSRYSFDFNSSATVLFGISIYF